VEAFLVSTSIVALAEIGDKTQLLAFVLAAKFRQATPIVLGILVATLANHAFAGAVGSWLTTLMDPRTLQWVLGISFIAMALWTLIPDKFDEADATLARLGVFGTTLVAFFLAEMGDKTQVATVALAAQYQALVAVVAGTTLGMMIANVPAVLLGERLAGRLPVRLVHLVAAALFAVIGIATLLGAEELFTLPSADKAA
jgi:putative Ca2+/H+ antiporter (TMEM165/GDT1 family)